MLGPLFGKELLETARRRRFFVVRVLIGAALLFGWWFALGGQSPTVAFNNIASLSVIGEALFRDWAYWSLWGAVLLTPMLVCGLIAAEKDGRTLETLLTTLLTNREILVGKAASRLLLLFILVGSSVPILSVASLYGGFNVRQVVDAAFVIAATAVFVLIVGMYYSTITFKPYIALIRTYFFLAILWWLLPAVSSIGVSPWRILRIAYGEPLDVYIGVQGLPTPPIQATGFGAISPDTTLQIAVAFFLHLAIVVVLLWRTDRLLRQRLQPGKPPWIFRAAKSTYQGLVGAARASVEQSKDPLSKLVWSGEKITERWHLRALERLADRNPLAYRNRVANAFDPERFVAAIQVLVGVGAVLLMICISLFGDAGSLSTRAFERLGSWALVGSTILFLFCSTILAACVIARERQYGSWDILMLADLAPWQHLSAAFRGVVGSLRLLSIILGAFAILVGYIWGGFVPTLIWLLSMGSLWLLVVSHALLASLCHRRIAGALAATLFGLIAFAAAPTVASWLIFEYAFPLLVFVALVVFIVRVFTRHSRRMLWPHLLATLLTAGTLILASSLTIRFSLPWNEGVDWDLYGYMDGYYTRHSIHVYATPLALVFSPMDWQFDDRYTGSQSQQALYVVPALLAGAAVNVALFLLWFRRLSRSEPGEIGSRRFK